MVIRAAIVPGPERFFRLAGTRGDKVPLVASRLRERIGDRLESSGFS